FIYWLFFGGGSTSYSVLVINQDRGATSEAGTTWNAGDDLIGLLQETVTYENGAPILHVRQLDERADAERQLKNRDAALLVIVPPDFTQTLAATDRQPGAVTFVGDLTNTYYTLAATFANIALRSEEHTSELQSRENLV